MPYLRLSDGQAVTLEIVSEPETLKTWWSNGQPLREDPQDGTRVRITHVVSVDDVAQEDAVLDVDRWEMSHTVKRNVERIAKRKNNGRFTGLRLYVEREGTGLKTTYHIEYIGANSTAMPAAQAQAASLAASAGAGQAVVHPPEPLPPEVAVPAPPPTPEQTARTIADNLAKAYALTANERRMARDYIAVQLAAGYAPQAVCAALLKSLRPNATLDAALCGEVTQ